jgi:hypothetical protein
MHSIARLRRVPVEEGGEIVDVRTEYPADFTELT